MDDFQKCHKSLSILSKPYFKLVSYDIMIFPIRILLMLSICFRYISTKFSYVTESEQRIVKGYECSPMDYPFLVSIGTTRRNHFCGGSLISKNLVLTAGHCCEDEGYFIVWTGLTRLRSLAQSAYVSSIHLHPNYSRDPLSSDLCVLQLSTAIHENEYTKYVPIVDAGNWSLWLEADACITSVAMGFGYQGIKWENGTEKDPNAPFNPVMQCVKLAVLKPELCQLGMDDTMFCAVDPLSEGRDPCQGDSGGPLVCKDTQIGIISAGFGCGIEGYASIYTRLDIFRDFLINMIEIKSSYTPWFRIAFYVPLGFIFLIVAVL